MSAALTVADLFSIAIDIERKGIAFYDVMSRSSEQKSVREIFQYLMGMERQHVLIFQEAFPLISQTEVQPGQESDYIRNLLNNSVFTDEMVESDMASQVETDLQAIELAIHAEKDSILFYYELKNRVAESPRDAVDRIIIEEKSHLGQLSELKKKMKAGGSTGG
jgi:rubrerythrin